MFLARWHALLLGLLLCAGCVRNDSRTDQHGLLAQSRWNDVSGLANFETARQQSYEAFSLALNSSGIASAYWVRLELDPQRASTTDWALRLRSRAVSDIEIHRDAVGPCAQPRTLDARQVAALPRSIVGWFTIPLCPADTVLYVRLESGREAFLEADVLTRDITSNHDVVDAAALYALLGGLGLAALLALGHMLAQRSSLAASQLLQLAGFTGYLWAQLSPQAATRLVDLALYQDRIDLRVWRIGMVLGLVAFLRSWLRTQRGPVPRLRSMDALLAVVVLALPLAMTQLLDLAELLSAVAFMVAMPLSVALAATGPGRWSTGKWASILVVLLGWGSALSIYYRVDAHSTAVTTLLFHGLLSGIILVRQAKASRDALRIATEQRLKAEARGETRELLLMLAHELRSPLSVINFHLASPVPSEAGKQRSQTAVQDMSQLIERCLQTARAEDEDQPVEVTALRVTESLSALADQWPESERLRWDVDPNLPAVRANPTLLHMVLSVLLDNALRYGAAGTPVRLAAKTRVDAGQQGVAVTVSNAVGRSGSPDPARVFQKYYRGAEAHHQTGAGLGLYLASRLAQRINAKLTLEPNPDSVNFVLWLPC